MSDIYRKEESNLGRFMDDINDELIRLDQDVQRDFNGSNEFINNLVRSAVSQEVCIPSIILAEEKRENGKITYVVDGGHRTKALSMFKYGGYKITDTIRNPIIEYSRRKRDEDGNVLRDEDGDDIFEMAEFNLTCCAS